MTEPTLAIAFGGGGARGLAHIHVIRAMENLGVAPIAISGSSIGSIMGAGLASGMDADDMRDFAIGTLTDPSEVLSRFWSMRPVRIGEIFSPPRAMLGNVNPIKAIRAFVPEQIPPRFEDLKIDLQTVATDFYGQKAVVHSTGDLHEAMAASSALPAIFKPVIQDGMNLVDGGLVNAVPYDLLFGKADIVIGVDVVGGPVRSHRPAPSRIEALAGASQLMMQATTNLKRRLQPPDAFISPPVGGIAVLDFHKARTVLEETSATVELAKRSIGDALDAKRSN